MMHDLMQKLAKKLKKLSYEEALQEAHKESERDFMNSVERNMRIDEHGAVKGKLVFALEAAIKADESGLPMEAQDVKALADMARRYIEGLDRYPGELGEANLLMQKRDRLGKTNREAALNRLVDLRVRGASSDHETFDKAGEEFGVSRETLRRLVNSRQEDTILFSSPGGGLGIGKISDLLKKK